MKMHNCGDNEECVNNIGGQCFKNTDTQNLAYPIYGYGFQNIFFQKLLKLFFLHLFPEFLTFFFCFFSKFCNTVGGYDCNCKEGNFKMGGVCRERDECALGVHNCDENAACLVSILARLFLTLNFFNIDVCIFNKYFLLNF